MALSTVYSSLWRLKTDFLPFLDVGIMKVYGKFVTKMYWKPTHTQQYIEQLIHRAHVICDLQEDLRKELNLLRNVFIRNGYPEKMVKTLQEYGP